jgi:hypothetical protein
VSVKLYLTSTLVFSKNTVVDSQYKVADWIASIKQEGQEHKKDNIV